MTSLQGLCQLRLMKDRGDPMLIKPINSKNKEKESQKERRDTLLKERRDSLYSEILGVAARIQGKFGG